MTFRLLLPLFMGASLILVGPPVFADDDDDDSDSTAPAWQVMIDKDSGEVLAAEDDSEDSPRMTETSITDTGRNSNISAMIPSKSQSSQYNADGSVSMQLGLENFKYLVVSAGENDEMISTHVPVERLELDDLSKPTGREGQ